MSLEESSGGVAMDKTIKTLSNTLTTLYEADLKELNGKLDEFKWVIGYPGEQVDMIWYGLCIFLNSGRQDQLNKEVQLEKEFFANNDNFKDPIALVSVQRNT